MVATRRKQVTIYVHRCQRCKRDWESRSKNPRRCGKCKSPYWNEVR